MLPVTVRSVFAPVSRKSPCGSRCARTCFTWSGKPIENLVTAFWNALSLFHRSSSLAESLHTWLRPYLQVHRGMPRWLLPLLQLVWNHHIFQRGKRQGKSPMELAVVENVPALSDLFDWLVEIEKPIPVSTEFTKVPEMYYPISMEKWTIPIISRRMRGRGGDRPI